jgi:hypothetical protein
VVSRRVHPHCSSNSFRFLGFLHWFVLGPGGLWQAPGGPGKAHGELWGGLLTTRGPGQKNPKTNSFCGALLRGQDTEEVTSRKLPRESCHEEVATRRLPRGHCSGAAARGSSCGQIPSEKAPSHSTKGPGRAGHRTGVLGRTYGEILAFSVGGRREHCREMA